MIPYHHYPRVVLEYCRCDNCGNDLRSRTLSRLYDRRAEKEPVKLFPKYKLKRKRLYNLAPKRLYNLAPIKKKLRPSPPYKLRREYRIRMKEMIKLIEVKNEIF